jgi:purine-binding chemotaxis protein CheW
MKESPMSQTQTKQEQADAKIQAGLKELAGKYLTFKLADEEYGIEILKVMEIIKLMDITAVPRTPHYVRGVINLRGKVIPVIDLRKKFDMDTIEDTDETCIIVVNVRREGSDVQMGILVDTVSEVLDIQAGEIEPAPKFGSSVHTEFIMGMAKAKGQVKILLDIDSILTGSEVDAMARV